MIDDRKSEVRFTINDIQKLCDRRFGIGADGVILLRNHPEVAFEMVYYNSDGSQSFCGNGSRCSLAFAKRLGIFENEADFVAIDGKHLGKSENGIYATKMGDVSTVEIGDGYYFIHTGSPHYMIWKSDLDQLNVVKEAREIRYNDRFKAEGTNVNFVQDLANNQLRVRTYERGVEGETQSCGTGVTAVAIANAVKKNSMATETQLQVEGGSLQITFERNGNAFTNIWLIGPAELVFEGVINWPL